MMTDTLLIILIVIGLVSIFTRDDSYHDDMLEQILDELKQLNGKGRNPKW